MADDAEPPSDDFDPFAALPLFGDLAKALQHQGPLNWDIARQLAMLGATEGNPEHNVDPVARIAYADLARIAGMHVNDVTGRDTAFPEPRIMTRGQWTSETLDAYRPLFTDMAASLSPAETAGVAEADDPLTRMLAGVSRMIAPAMMGMSVGSMVGALSKRVFGLHDLPIPRTREEVVLVAATIDRFAEEWSISLDEMRLWVLAHELSGYQLFAIDSVRESLSALVRRHVGGFRPDPSSMIDKLSGSELDQGSDPAALMQQLFSDPELLLGAVRSDDQRALAPRLDAAVAAVIGFTDWVVDAVAARLIGGDALAIAEAVRRQRVEVGATDVFIERLLGIRVGDDQVGRGKQFIQGVVDRVGEHQVLALFERPDSLPTPSEIEAPGLWIARLGELDQ